MRRGSERASAGAGFAVERVSVRGARQTDLTDIREALEPQLGRSVFHVDMNAARARVEELGVSDHDSFVIRLLILAERVFRDGFESDRG